ncbi:MAG: enoyl-CoA hydratase-related protein [Candidatus Poseidoniaceae archaeon]|nr:enoyl-CoA hydratase-related protein [Candidatus Poseidoniaceae archaeon]
MNIPACEHLHLEVEGAVLNIGLSRESVYNALNTAMITELCEVFDWSASRSAGPAGALEDEDGPLFRLVVLHGLGKHFCAGADINMMRDAGAKTPEENREDSARLDRLFNGLWSHPCYTIAVLHGVALGGGAGLISACDHVVAVEGARIALSEGKLGILPAVIGPYVYRRVGSAAFRRLAMNAGRVGTDEAQRIGLIEDVVQDHDAAWATVAGVVAEVMTTGPSAVTAAKELTLGFDRWTGDDQALRTWTLDFTSRMRGSDEGQEGLSAFLEKRPQAWRPSDGGPK